MKKQNRKNYEPKFNNIFCTVMAIVSAFWIAGILIIDWHYQCTVTNELQRWANSTGATGLYIMFTTPILFYVMAKVSDFLEAREDY